MADSITTPNGVIQAGDTVVARIQNRRGYKINLPQPLAPGELGWCIDTKELFIGLDDSESSSSITITDQTEVQRLLDDEMTEYQSKWGYLNGTVDGAVDAGANGESRTEEELMRNYLTLSPADFINGSTLVSDVEDNVYTLTQFKNAIATQIQPSLQADKVRVTTTEETDAILAKVIVTSITGGVIDGIALNPDLGDEGLGYFEGDTVTIPNAGGDSATLNITVVDDGQGKIATFVLVYGGTAYPAIGGSQKFTVSAPDLSIKTATATNIQVSGGELINVDIDNMGGEYRTKPYVDVFGGGAVIDAIVEAVWNPATRQITGFTIGSGEEGVGYTTAPSVVVRAPLSKGLYKFRYDFGFPLGDSGDIATSNTDLNAVDDVLFNTTKLIDSVAGSQSQLLGAGGQGKTVVIDASGQPVLVMDTPNQASATTNIINEINSSSAALAQASQNVEILTEYSTLPAAPPSVVIPTEDLESATLAPTGANTWTDILYDDKNNPGNTLPLSYDPNVTNSMFLKYSLIHASGDYFLQNGHMNIVVTATDSDVTTSSTEVKESPSLDSSLIYFRTRIALGITYIQYWHTFPNDVELKFASTEWLA